MCSSECFLLITESNNAVKSKTEGERQRKKETRQIFIGLIRCLTKTTCKKKKENKRQKQTHMWSVQTVKALTLTEPTLPTANRSLKWRGGSVWTLKTYLHLLNGSWCPCCLGNHKILSIQLSAPLTYGKYPRCPFNFPHTPHVSLMIW